MVQIVLSILAVSVVLALASLLLPLAARLRAPHTVLLAALGMALGFVVALLADPQRFGFMGDIAVGLRELGFTAEAFLFIFLPPLLFTAGLNIDVRRLVDELAAVILMAVVAVLVCIAVVGSALHWVSGESAVACFLLGAIVSTTDPAAVIGIFRDIGAPRRLSILVEGESLLNDAAAIAVFALLIDIVTGKTAEMNNGEAILAFLREFLGGLAVGFVLGRIACWLLTILGGSHVGHVTITMCLAYIAFILGDRYLHVSGVVAVVGSALTVAAYGPTRVSPNAWRSLLKAWHQLEFWANSLIFVLAAMLAARVLEDLQWHDLVLLMVLILAAMVARFVVLFGLLPGLSALRLVAPVDNRYKAVIVWGGLRGAVTVVLALVAIGSPTMPEPVRHFIGVLAILFVLFSLFVNGTTLRLLMRAFGLNKLSATELALRDRAMVLSRHRIADQVKTVARTYGLESALPKILPGLVESESSEGGAAQIGVDEATQVGLLTLAAREKELYLRHFEERIVSRRMVARLVAAAERLADMAKAHGVQGYVEGTRRFAERNLSLRLALSLNRRLGIEGPLSQQLADHCEMLLTGQLVLGELLHFNRGQLNPLLGATVASGLTDMLEKRRESIDGALAALSLQYGGYADKMRQQYLTRAALRFEGAEYDRQVSEGIISHEVYDDLQRQLAQRRAAASQRPPLDLGMELRDMLSRVPMFADLDNEAAALLGRLLRPVMALPGEEIVRKGARGREMYFIASGAVEVLVGVGSVRLEAGDFFGELALLADRPRTADVVAAGYCHLLELSRSDLRRIMRANPGLRQEIEKVAAERLSTHEVKR